MAPNLAVLPKQVGIRPVSRRKYVGRLMNSLGSRPPNELRGEEAVVIKRAVALLTATALCAVAAASANAADQPWRDTSQPPLQRADELLAALSFDQKVDLALNDFSSTAQFGVPPIVFDDGPSGVRANGTTSWPSMQTLASTFDRSLARAYGSAVAQELRGKGFNTWAGPAMDIDRTPLAGRQPENLGEDPFLAGHTVAAEVHGVKSVHAIETLKHYVGNNQEYERTGFAAPTGGHTPAIDDNVSERALQEIYETPFRIGVQRGGADAVMCSYNRVNGNQACESHEVLDTLKLHWGFEGFVVPDFVFAVRDPVKAANAGVDEAALPGDPTNGLRTRAMFTSGQVSAARLDDMVRRMLFAMFDSGVFDDPVTGPPQDVVSTPAHRDLATRISESGMVLLKNRGNALPLSTRKLSSLAVIGPSGDDAMFINGGSAAVPITVGSPITPLAGITARATGVTINAAQGSLGDAPLPSLVPSSALSPSSGRGHGLFGQYWTNGDQTGSPRRTEVDGHLNVTTSPADLGPIWSARWTGTITPPQTGLYRFSLLEAGIAKLTIDGRQVAGGYREGTSFVAGPPYPESGAIELTKGHPVSIRVDYSSKSGLFGHSIQLQWQLPSASGIPPAVDAARRSDAAVVLVNNAQGEGMDRSTLALPGDQDALIEAVAAVNPHTIVVLNNGGPVLMPWLHDVDAVLQAWYPGQQFGAALASVLFGDHDPGGRLPVTYPASDTQGPALLANPANYPGVNGEERYDEGIFVGYRWYDEFHQRPLFPFGFGLSYASFRLSRFQLLGGNGGATVGVRVRNTSGRGGSQVVQLYVRFPASAGEPPKQLKAYRKVTLGPGESRDVVLRVRRSDLRVFGGGDWTVTPGRYTVLVGTSSRDLPLRGSFAVTR
jgi:beta-glucosidase